MIVRVCKKINRYLWYYLNRRKFRLLNSTCTLQHDIRIDGMQGIELHEGSIVQRGSWLAAVPVTGASSALLKIGKNTVIGNYNHIYAASSIVIEDYVLTADRVYISDCAHCYQNVTMPIVKQPIRQLKTITIGSGAWIGENACIIGASIGKNSIIGANSVVTCDVPDYCVAVGSPAKIIKKYNLETRQWEKC